MKRKKGKFLIELPFNHLGNKDARWNLQINQQPNKLKIKFGFEFRIERGSVDTNSQQWPVNDKTNLINYYNVIISEKFQANS